LYFLALKGNFKLARVVDQDLRNLLVNIEDFHYDNKFFWSPEIYVVNAVNVKEEVRHTVRVVEKSPNQLRDVKSADIAKARTQQASSLVENLTVMVTEIRKMRGLFYERLELNDFPVDLQELSVTLSSNKPSTEVEMLEDMSKENFVNTVRFYDQQQWELFGFCTSATDEIFDDFKGITRTEVKFTSFVTRKYQFYVYK
jgi:hypothetical protein